MQPQTVELASLEYITKDRTQVLFKTVTGERIAFMMTLAMLWETITNMTDFVRAALIASRMIAGWRGSGGKCGVRTSSLTLLVAASSAASVAMRCP